MVPNKEIDNLISVAHELADCARPIAIKYFRTTSQGIENKLKSGFDPVTIADKEIELAMRDILKRKRPNDSILGEEFADVSGTSEFTWVLDPIDGTKGYMSGTPTWGVLIAVNAGAGPVLGIIDQPYTGERFIGAVNKSQFIRSNITSNLFVRRCSDISDAVLFSTMPDIGTPTETQAFNRVMQRTKLSRFGMDCYAYALLAAGQIDLVIEAGLNAFDIQAPIAVIENAGGIVTNWQGGPAYMGGQVIAAGDPIVHKQALEILNA